MRKMGATLVNDLFRFTAAGRLWLQNHEIEMVPLLPVRVETLRKRRRRNIAVRNGFYSTSKLPQDIDRALLRAQNAGEGQTAVKQRVLTWLKDDGIGEFPDGEHLSVIALESDQRFFCTDLVPNGVITPWKRRSTALRHEKH